MSRFLENGVEIVETKRINRMRRASVSRLLVYNSLMNDVERFCAFVKSLNLDYTKRPKEFGYKNPVLIVTDAALSINRQYETFVAPRIRLMESRNVRSLKELRKIIKRKGQKGFCKFWDYNHPARVDLLDRLAKRFLKTQKDLGIKDEAAALRKWGKLSIAEDYKTFNVKGIGFTTFQYLRMLCGADTIKPDVHVSRMAKKALGRNLSPISVVELIEQSAKKMEIRARELDYAIWFYSSKNTYKKSG